MLRRDRVTTEWMEGASVSCLVSLCTSREGRSVEEEGERRMPREKEGKSDGAFLQKRDRTKKNRSIND